ncbi:MAG: factor H binding family protein [Neisseria zoodegmatis]|uniref:factor H binding protein domain-containing protein n=1 Tax=Neisseria zoodegmatis TaxID=326523 RepID=UPI0026EA2256|nr:factor H binding protein domain-containing protein [Neisseria zoodegmatis]MDO5068661.1 factor H binding family protein [Neisseria zoodegmatis]
MSIHKKIGLATFIALGLAACGSGGSDGPSAAATPNADIRAAKAELAAVNAGEVGKTTFKVNDYTIKLGETTHKVADMQKGAVVDLQNGNENVRAYRQAYSIVAGKFDVKNITGGSAENSVETLKDPMTVGLINGEATQTLPTTGKYTYNGAAFSNSETGRLTYNVDFDKKVGSGAVTGLVQTGDIKLEEAAFKHNAWSNDLDGTSVRAHGIAGKVSKGTESVGDYSLNFFGQNAEEVAGVVYHNQVGNIGIAGQR